MLSGIDAVVGACETISQAQLGEMVLTTTQGIPNFQTVWIGVPNLKIWQSYLQNTLQNVAGVNKVTNFTFSAQNNILSYIADIETIFGTTTISG